MNKEKQDFIDTNKHIIEDCVNGSSEAINRFFNHNKPLIGYIVNYYSKLLPSYQRDDLYQEAYYGFLRALKRFDYSKLKTGRPESFFITNIHAAVQKYTYKNRRIYNRNSYLEDHLY
ncbi:MAG: hypothetical protein D6707_12980, partial [Bacteroidetes bacterium]